jgi:transcriptional regulator with XRE-family HTH domain
MSFGRKIRQLRLQRDLTQAQVTAAMGYGSNSYISDIEIGKFIPSPEKLARLADALGVTEDEMDDLLLEDRLEQLGLDDPAFTMMFKEVPRMTTEEKQSLIRAYEAVLKARGRRDHETGDEASGGGP